MLQSDIMALAILPSAPPTCLVCHRRRDSPIGLSRLLVHKAFLGCYSKPTLHTCSVHCNDWSKVALEIQVVLIVVSVVAEMVLKVYIQCNEQGSPSYPAFSSDQNVEYTISCLQFRLITGSCIISYSVSLIIPLILFKRDHPNRRNIFVQSKFTFFKLQQ